MRRMVSANRRLLLGSQAELCYGSQKIIEREFAGLRELHGGSCRQDGWLHGHTFFRHATPWRKLLPFDQFGERSEAVNCTVETCLGGSIPRADVAKGAG